jgi:hypothetical protein
MEGYFILNVCFPGEVLFTFPLATELIGDYRTINNVQFSVQAFTYRT